MGQHYLDPVQYILGKDNESPVEIEPEPEPQVTNFVEAVRTRKKFALNESNGHRSCSLVNLGVIALRTGRALKFNPTTQRFVDDAAADAYVRQPMREAWQIG